MADESGLRADAMLMPELEPVSVQFDKAAKAILERYGFGNCILEQICYSENHTYRITRQNDKPFATLRVCRPGYRSLGELQSEIAWLASLHSQVRLDGIEIIRPMPALDGTAIQVATMPDGEVFHGVVFSYMEGLAPDEADGEAMRRLFRRLGALAAALHEHTRGLGTDAVLDEQARSLGPGVTPNEQTWGLEAAVAPYGHGRNFGLTAGPCGASKLSITRPVWDCDSALGSHALWGDWRAFAAFAPQERELLECAEARIRAIMAAYGKPREHFGLIHADMRLANLLVEGETLKLLDFDDCAYSWHLFDLAASLSFIEARPDLAELIAAWLEGYRAVPTLCPLADMDLAVVPSLIMMRRLQLTGWLATRHDSDPVSALLPAWKSDTLSLAARYLQG